MHTKNKWKKVTHSLHSTEQQCQPSIYYTASRVTTLQTESQTFLNEMVGYMSNKHAFINPNHPSTSCLVTSILLSSHNQISLTTQIPRPFTDFGPFPRHFTDHSRIPRHLQVSRNSRKAVTLCICTSRVSWNECNNCLRIDNVVWMNNEDGIIFDDQLFVAAASQACLLQLNQHMILQDQCSAIMPTVIPTLCTGDKHWLAAWLSG